MPDVSTLFTTGRIRNRHKHQHFYKGLPGAVHTSGFKKHLERSQGRCHPQTAQAGGTCPVEYPLNVGAGRREVAAPFSPVLMCRIRDHRGAPAWYEGRRSVKLNHHVKDADPAWLACVFRAQRLGLTMGRVPTPPAPTRYASREQPLQCGVPEPPNGGLRPVPAEEGTTVASHREGTGGQARGRLCHLARPLHPPGRPSEAMAHEFTWTRGRCGATTCQ